MTDRSPVGFAFPLDQRHDVPISALDRYECARVQH
jgi:hypothetical protein